jgi:hypothetical protein
VLVYERKLAGIFFSHFVKPRVTRPCAAAQTAEIGGLAPYDLRRFADNSGS